MNIAGSSDSPKAYENQFNSIKENIDDMLELKNIKRESKPFVPVPMETTLKLFGGSTPLANRTVKEK